MTANNDSIKSVEISGIQNVDFSENRIISGAVSNYYPYFQRNYSLNINISGNLERNIGIDGVVRMSSSINDPSKINLKMFSLDWELEAGNVDRIADNSITGQANAVAIKGKIEKERYSLSGGFGTPIGNRRVEYFTGTNSQGPFQLTNSPLQSMSERIFIIYNGEKRELKNGQDYFLDYRTGQLTLKFILYDSQYIEVRYYDDNISISDRYDYSVSGTYKTKYFKIGLDCGGEQTSIDSLEVKFISHKLAAAVNVSAFIDSILQINASVMGNAEKEYDSLLLQGKAFSSDGGLRWRGFDIGYQVFKPIDNFGLLGVGDYTTFLQYSLRGKYAIGNIAEIYANLSKEYSSLVNNKTSNLGASTKFWSTALAEYSYNESSNYLDSLKLQHYYGHSVNVSKSIEKSTFGIEGNYGVSESSDNDTVAQYKPLSGVIFTEFSIDNGHSGRVAIKGEHRSYEDSVQNIYIVTSKYSYSGNKYIKTGLNGEYSRYENANLISGNADLSLKIGTFAGVLAKIKIETDDRYITTEATEQELKYNLQNNLTLNPIKNINLQYTLNSTTASGIITKFNYQENIMHIGNATWVTPIATVSINGGYGKNIFYRNIENPVLQSDNRRQFAIANLAFKSYKGYSITDYFEYSKNSGLTMQYFPTESSDETDTISNIINSLDYKAGWTTYKTYSYGKASFGYEFVSNENQMPDSITTDANSHVAFIKAEREIIDNLMLSVKLTGEKRTGIDPDIERTADSLNIIITSPEIGLMFTVLSFGNAVICYKTSIYSLDSVQMRHLLTFQTGIKLGSFSVNAAAEYSQTKFYKTLEYNAGIKLIL